MLDRKKIIGKNLKRILKQKRMTYEELAEKIDITRQAIQTYVAGKSAPTMDTMDKITKALDISLIELIGTTREKEEAEVGRKILRDIKKSYIYKTLEKDDDKVQDLYLELRDF